MAGPWLASHRHARVNSLDRLPGREFGRGPTCCRPRGVFRRGQRRGRHGRRTECGNDGLDERFRRQHGPGSGRRGVRAVLPIDGGVAREASRSRNQRVPAKRRPNTALRVELFTR